MKKPLHNHIVLVLCFILVSTSLYSINNVKVESAKNAMRSNNENILAQVFLYTNWLSVEDIMSRSYSELRNTLIDYLDHRCNDNLSSIQALSDDDLGWSALLYYFLKEKMGYTESQLLSMSLDDYRNTIITQNSEYTTFTISELQSYSNAKNLNIAYGWWFTKNADFTNKLNILDDISGSSPYFDIKDDRNINMEVMRVVLANESSYKYLAVYHYQISSNHYVLALAGSNDFTRWTFINTLGDRSHQGDIKKWGNGYLLVNEQDPIEGSNNVRIRYYDSYANLITNISSNDYSITRNFSTTAEGTPDIRSIIGNTPETSHIVIGFHYYDGGVRDQLATGILYHFGNWRAWKNDISNYNIGLMGYSGNIGSRSSFVHNYTYVLQEAQITSNDWSTWRLLLGDGAFYETLSPVTSKGSVSFANPAIADIGSDWFSVGSFLPSEGNQDGEKGQLLYKVYFGTSVISDKNIMKNNDQETTNIKVFSRNHSIKIENALGCNVKIYNIEGELLYTNKITSTSEYLSLVSGFYLVNLYDSNQNITFKLIDK